MSTTSTINPDGDSYLSEYSPTTNYGTNANLYSGIIEECSGLPPICTEAKDHAVFKFDVSAYNPTEIVSANFTLTKTNMGGRFINHDLTLARLTLPFVESEVTWNQASAALSSIPFGGGENYAALTEPTYTINVGDGSPDSPTIDIKYLVIDAINKRDGILWLYLGFKPTDTPSGQGWNSWASNDNATADDRPKLVTTVADRIRWIGSVSGDMDNNLNWGGTTPTSTDYALFTGTPSNSPSTGTLDSDRAYVSRSYKKNLGASDTLLTVNCNEFHLSSPHADVYVDLNDSESTNTDLRIRDTNAKAGSIIFDGKYDATITRTRSDISLLTDDVDLVNALTRSATFTCDNKVTTVRLGGASATLHDGGQSVTMVNGSSLLCYSDDNVSTGFTISDSLLKLLAESVGFITLYSGVINCRGNTGAPFVIGAPLSSGAWIYGGLFNTRTDSSNFSVLGTILMHGGRFLTDADTNAAPA